MHPPSYAYNPGTVVDVLLARARAGEKGGFSFLGDGASVTESLSWSELAARVSGVSAQLRKHCAAGDRALLLFWPGLDFVVSFLGCLHAGVIAVPCVPPRRPLRRSLDRIGPIVQAAGPSVVLASGVPLAIAQELRSSVPALAKAVLVDPADSKGSRATQGSSAMADGVAFLQFTSGSTSAPKGVVVTHANLLQNLAYMHEAVRLSPNSVSVTWLPPYHDMGLIDGILQPIFGGFQCYAMPPHAFLQRPIRWLRAISRYRATHTGGPNFAYGLCVDKISSTEAAQLDLSSLTSAYNGAEPIRVSTLDAFVRRFASAGFRPETVVPCYGLAEATLLVSVASASRPRHRTLDAEALERNEVRESVPGAPEARTIASCGTTDAFDVRIVDPESREDLGEGKIGEIWLSGPSVTAGYFGDAEATEAVFQARTLDGRGPYLRTGDLGFLRECQLYVTGRRKDLIILAGRNLYPQDIELSAERAAASLEGGSAVAFGRDDGQREDLVVMVEAAPKSEAFDEIIERVSEALSREHEVDVAFVVLVARGELLRTSSGKIRRQACKRAYQNGELRVLEQSDAFPRSGSMAVAREHLGRVS
jgi:acyl-CoA synthetase (AMP-forming)/AMP-acid ligase II